MKKPSYEIARLEERPAAAKLEARRFGKPWVAASARGWAADERGSLFVAGMIWLSIIYMVVPIGDYTLAAPDLTGMAEPNILFRAIKLVLIGVSCIVIVWRAGFAWLLFKNTNRLFLFCLALIAASVYWSIDSAATFARVVSLASIVFVCYAFVLVGWHAQRVQNVIRPIVTTLLVASIIFGLLFPDFAIETGEGTLKDAWKGLTYQKNQFGILASIGAVFWLHALLTREAKPLKAALGTALSVVCLLLSRSSTSLLSTVLTTAFMLVLLFLPGSLRRYMPLIVGTFASVVVIYALAVLNLVPALDVILTPITDLVGKDLTFSNRSAIWLIIKEHIDASPLLGSGYGAYWTGPVPSSPSYEFLARMNFYPTESHNGYIEIANDLGFVGLLGCLGYLIWFVRDSLRLMLVQRNQAVLYLCIFFQQAIGNLSESYWLQIGFGFTVFTLATFGTARAFLDQKLVGYFGAQTDAAGKPMAVAAGR